MPQNERLSELLKPVWAELLESHQGLQGFSFRQKIRYDGEGKWEITPGEYDLDINGGSVGYGMAISFGETPDLVRGTDGA